LKEFGGKREIESRRKGRLQQGRQEGEKRQRSRKSIEALKARRKEVRTSGQGAEN